MRTATVALIVNQVTGTDEGKGQPVLSQILSDDREIEILDHLSRDGASDPWARILEMREQQQKEDEEFAEYVEGLLSNPFVRPEVQEHGVQWLKSRIRIEQFQKSEAEAAKIIAEYAFQLFVGAPEKTDFFLAGPNARVRVRVYILSENKYPPSQVPSSSEAA